MSIPPIVEECYKKSIENLLNNSTEYGLRAATIKDHESKCKSYTSLFPRDIGVSSLGILASGNAQLIEVLKTSLITLTEAQSELGQFPFYYKPFEKIVKWWTPGTIDGTLWWCIAFLKFYQHTGDKDFYNTYKVHLDKGYTWLLYQDTNNDYLLEQGEASDWADEMPRMGTVLYSNALWYWLIRLRAEIEQRSELEKVAQFVYDGVNTLLWVHKESSDNVNYIPKNSYTERNRFAAGMIEIVNSKVVYLPYYLGYVCHKNFEMRCDVFGNILAGITGLANDHKAQHIKNFIIRSNINQPYPVKVLYPPIYPGETDFKEYMSKGRQNFPWQYHNGGIWPFVGAFWIMFLAAHDRDLAEKEIVRLAEANALNDFEYNEYLHGEYGTPMGITYQSWNMAMFIAAYHTLYESLS